ARGRIRAVAPTVGHRIGECLGPPVALAQPLVGRRAGARGNAAPFLPLRVAGRGRPVRRGVNAGHQLAPQPVVEAEQRLDDEVGQIVDDVDGHLPRDAVAGDERAVAVAPLIAVRLDEDDRYRDMAVIQYGVVGVGGVENRAFTTYRLRPNSATVVGTSKSGDV